MNLQVPVSSIDLIRTVGHELKMPLISIANTASLLADGDFDEEEKLEQYKHLELNTRRMLNLIDSVLFAGQVETNQTQLKLEPTNVASVLHVVVLELRQIAKRYDKTISLKITSELSPAAVDPLALHYALYGLLDMLIRSSASREIDILIHHQTDSIMVTMKDIGPAFSVNQVMAAFGRFGRASQPFKKLPNTTGMALFVALSLARAMQGSLGFKQVGESRMLSLRVPLSQQMQLV